MTGPDSPPTLVGERLTLRPLRAADVEPLNAIIAQPDVRQWWGTDPTVDDQDAFTIVVDGEIAGWVGWYEETDPDYRHGGLDIFLSPAFHGRGLGREALLVVARWLIAERGHHRLIIDPAADQHARDPDVHVDRLQARRRDAPLRAGAGRDVARRVADGPARGGAQPQLR